MNLYKVHCKNIKMFIGWHDDHDYGTETRDQEPKDDSDSPIGCPEDGKNITVQTVQPRCY